MNTREKITATEELLARAAEARASGRQIVFAAGRFDLISFETIEALQFARNAPALVVAAVAPDTDASRSLLAAEARAQLVAALGSVDVVVIGAAEAIRMALKPNQSLELSADLAPKLIEHFRLEPRE